MSLAQSGCVVADSSWENRSNNMSTAEGSVRIANVKNLVQTIVQHLAFWETINLILTTTNQKQLTCIARTASAKVRSLSGVSIHPAFKANCPTMGGQFSNLALWNLSLESARTWKFEILVEDSGTGGPNLIAVRIECLFTIIVPVAIC